MDSIRSRWSEILVVGLAEFAVATIASLVVNEVVKHDLVRDIGIVVVWSSAILGGAGLLVARVTTSSFLRRGDTVRLEAAEGSANNGKATPFVFDPYSLYTELGGVDLSGLFRTESFMLITLDVRNVSGYLVKITGVKGRIRCAGEECNMNPTVEREPRNLLPTSAERVPCTIRQPLSSEMMNKLALEGVGGDGSLTISLAGLEWVGSVVSPRGPVPLENCYLQVGDFVVQGPITDAKDGVTLFALGQKFVSSERYDGDGRPKQADSDTAGSPSQ